MDSIVGEPERKRYNPVWVVVHCLTWMRYLVPCTEQVDGKKPRDLNIKEVFWLHTLPESIVLHSSPQFTSELGKYICDRFGIERRLSTAFHPQRDGQTEGSNTGFEQLLRSFVNDQLNDWVKWLPMAEFTADNHESETLQCSMFYGNSGFHRRMRFGQHPIHNSSDVWEVNVQETAKRMTQLFDELRAETKRTKAIHFGHAIQ
jgi:hypothetical protein